MQIMCIVKTLVHLCVTIWFLFKFFGVFCWAKRGGQKFNTKCIKNQGRHVHSEGRQKPLDVPHRHVKKIEKQVASIAPRTTPSHRVIKVANYPHTQSCPISCKLQTLECGCLNPLLQGQEVYLAIIL